MDLEDDWLFDSIKKYKRLYMYDLQKPVQAADWLSSESLIVSISDERRHEILELSLPAQLCVEEDNTGLTKDRDFQLLSGGFSDSCITSLHHLLQTRKVLACLKGDNSVEIWQLQSGDKNLIEKVGIINNKTSTCHSSRLCIVDSGQLVFGSHLSGICVADLTTQKVISYTHDCSTDSLISNMVKHDNKNILTCDRTTGQLYQVDPRVAVLKPQTVSGPCPGGVSPDTWALCEGVSDSEQGVIQVSSSGTMCVRDCRNLQQCVKEVQTNVQTCGPGTVRMSSCLSNPELLALSGISGSVYLYDKSSWQSSGVVTPVFVHEGHLVERDDPTLDITTNTHLWYPWKQQTLLSASSDGGLHIYQPVL